MLCHHQTIAEQEACGLCHGTGDTFLGRTIGAYTLVRRLGQGGFGSIYEARHNKIERRAAIKLLNIKQADPELAIKRFQREALALSRLRHPLALRVYEQGKLDGGPFYLVMELIEGETLEEYLRRAGLIQEDTLRAWMRTLCELLEEAHQAGITHRDLKPANIMLPPGGEPRLVDFGLAGLVESETLTQSGVVSGTPKYMAPEQWEGLSRTDARSDIYSLGVIMYECLSGQLPFQADSPLAWMKQHYFSAPRELSLAMGDRPLSASMGCLVMRAIAKKPEDRFQSATDLLRALQQKEPLADTPTPPPTPKKKRRAPIMLAGLSSALILLAVVSSRSQEEPNTAPAKTQPITLAAVPSMEETLLARAKELASRSRWSEAEAAAAAAGEAGASLAKEYHQRAALAVKLQECRSLLEAESIDEAFSLCAPLSSLDDAGAREAAKRSRDAFLALHAKNINDAIALRSSAGISKAKEEVALLQERLGADSSIEELQRVIEEQERSLTPSSAALLAKIEQQRISRQFNEMCRTIKKHLKTFTDSPASTHLRQELERYDPAAYPSCEPK